VIASMLSGSEASVLDSQNAKAYENDKEIKQVNALRVAHLKRNVTEFGKVIWEMRKDADPYLGTPHPLPAQSACPDQTCSKHVLCGVVQPSTWTMW
jgi:hypothetical protein